MNLDNNTTLKNIEFLLPKLVSFNITKINNILVTCRVNDLLCIIQFFYNNTLTLYKQCVDIVMYDNISYSTIKRYTVVYIIRSIVFNSTLTIYTQLADLQSLNSVITIYRNSKWLERELSEIYGIFVYNNPELRRLLLDYGFKGHPLRKDFPLTGYTELVYDTQIQQIIYTNVELTQEYRNIYI